MAERNRLARWRQRCHPGWLERLGIGLARCKRSEAAFQRGDGLLTREIAEQLHLDRSLFQDRLPDLAETIGRCRFNFLGGWRAETGITTALQEVQIAFQHTLGRGGEALITQPRRCLGAQHRRAIPARLGELLREEVKLIRQVGRTGIGRKLERGVLDRKVIAHLAAGTDPIELFLAKLALAGADQRHVAQRDIGGIAGVESAVPGPEADLDRNAARLVRGRPEQDLDAIGKFELLDAQDPGRAFAYQLAGLANRRHFGKGNRLAARPRLGVGQGRRRERRRKRCGFGLAGLRRHIDRARDRSLEQFAGVLKHRLRGEQRARAVEDLQDGFGRSDRFADVERGDHVIGQLGPGEQAALLDRAFEGDVEFGDFTLDLVFARRGRKRIGDHAAHFLERLGPILVQRRDRDKGRIGRLVNLFLIDLSKQEAAAAPRPCFEPAIEDRLGQRIQHDPLVVGDRILNRAPRPHDGVGDPTRQVRFYQHAGRPDWIGCLAAGRSDRIAKGGCGGALARRWPIGKVLADHGFDLSRLDIADDDNHRIFRPVPARVERADRGLIGGLQGFGRADDRADRQPLPGEQGLLRGIGNPFGQAAALALFSQDNRHFGAHVRLGQRRGDHHPRKELQRFIKLVRGCVRQVELEGGRNRAGLGIGVAAKGGPQPLPGGDRSPFSEVARLAENQVFEQVGKAALTLLLM